MEEFSQEPQEVNPNYDVLFDALLTVIDRDRQRESALSAMQELVVKSVLFNEVSLDDAMHAIEETGATFPLSINETALLTQRVLYEVDGVQHLLKRMNPTYQIDTDVDGELSVYLK